MIYNNIEPINYALIFGISLGFYLINNMAATVAKSMTIIRGGLE